MRTHRFPLVLEWSLLILWLCCPTAMAATVLVPHMTGDGDGTAGDPKLSLAPNNIYTGQGPDEPSFIRLYKTDRAIAVGSGMPVTFQLLGKTI